MGSKERRDRERTETRQRILDAARDMFTQDGYDTVTMRAIADRIEYTPTAIYHHFANKQDLLTELCTCDFRALAHAFARIGRIADPVERLWAIGQAYLEFALEHPSQYRFMFMTPLPKPAPKDLQLHPGDPSEDAYAFLRQTVVEAIATGRLRPELTDPDVVAQVLWACVHGLASLHIAKGHDEWVHWRDARETGRLLIDALNQGILRR